MSWKTFLVGLVVAAIVLWSSVLTLPRLWGWW